MLQVWCDNGKLNVSYRNIPVRDVGMSVSYDGGHYNTLDEKSKEWSVVREGDAFVATSGRFVLRFYEAENGFLFEPRWKAPRDYNGLLFFHTFCGFWDSNIKRAVVTGFSECNGNAMNEMQAVPDTAVFLENGEKISSDAALFSDGKGRAAVFGAASFCEYFSRVRLTSDGEMGMMQALDGHKILEGEELTGDAGCVIFGKDGAEALQNYSAAVNGRMQNRRTARETPSGWCSWYYYGKDVSEADILENVYALKKAEIGVRYVLIDDGWERAKGDWEPNGKFSDMKALAENIAAAGFVPGLWVAPFCADEDSALFRDHPDWLVKNYDDDGIFGYPSIDFSNPEAQEFLYALFAKISREWGYRYIKVDLVLGALSAGRHCDAHCNGIRNYRLAMEIINKAVTPDTYILACTSPIGASIGVADGMRVSCDIFERWESLRAIAKPTLKRFYYHKINFNCDPDCLLARTAEEEDEKCFRLCTRDRQEIDTFISLIAASGGAVFVGDKISLLKEETIRKIKYLLPPSERQPVPLDLESSDIPSAVDCGRKGNMRTLIYFNWSDREKVYTLAIKNRAHIFEFWSQRYLGTASSLRFSLPAHASKVFFVTEAEGTVPVGTDNALLPELQFNARGKCFEGVQPKTGGRWTVFSRVPLRARENCTAEKIGENLYEVNIENGKSRFLIEED